MPSITVSSIKFWTSMSHYLKIISDAGFSICKYLNDNWEFEALEILDERVFCSLRGLDKKFPINNLTALQQTYDSIRYTFASNLKVLDEDRPGFLLSNREYVKRYGTKTSSQAGSEPSETFSATSLTSDRINDDSMTKLFQQINSVKESKEFKEEMVANIFAAFRAEDVKNTYVENFEEEKDSNLGKRSYSNLEFVEEIVEEEDELTEYDSPKKKVKMESYRVHTISSSQKVRDKAHI